MPFGLAAFFFLVTWCLPGGLQLRIAPKGGGDPLLLAPLEPGERFTLRYIHSVDMSPVWEEHSADRKGCIYIEEERCRMFGAGMGHWRGHGTLTSRGPYQIIENIHEPVGEFVLRVGSEDVDHTIIWREVPVHLSRQSAGQAVVISARPISLLQRAWRRLIPHPATPTPQARHRD
jgi:hypothetical protein